VAIAQLYPGAKWTPLGAQTETLMTGHDIVCLHTMVGYLISTDKYFRIYNGAGYSGTESHYGVGGKWGPDLGSDLDGAVWQWQDRRYQADANLNGNNRVISIETADNAARPIQPWTPKQLEANARIIAWESSPSSHRNCPSTWACHKVGIPLKLIPDTQPGRRGIGYHRQGCDPWRVTGGVLWSTAYGKDCPTQARINQIPGIIDRARQLSYVLAAKPISVTGIDIPHTPPPPPFDLLRKATDMILVKQAGTDPARIWLLTGTSRRHVADLAAFQTLKAAGVPYDEDAAVSSEMLQWFQTDMTPVVLADGSEYPVGKEIRSTWPPPS
jgi:hypothetical protein